MRSYHADRFQYLGNHLYTIPGPMMKLWEWTPGQAFILLAKYKPISYTMVMVEELHEDGIFLGWQYQSQELVNGKHIKLVITHF